MNKIFQNSKFIKREFDCTYVVYCETDKAPNEYWIETKLAVNQLPQYMEHLYTENNIKYYGYL